MKVNTQSINCDRSSVPVETRVANSLKVKRNRRARVDGCGVVCFDDRLFSVPEPPVTDLKTNPSGLEISAMVRGQAAYHNGYHHAVLGSTPRRPAARRGERGGAVDFGVGERLGLSIVPPNSNCDAPLFPETLLGVDAPPNLASLGPSRPRDVGYRGSAFGDCLIVIAHPRMVYESQSPDHPLCFRVECPFELQVFAVSLPEVMIELRAVRDRGHGVRSHSNDERSLFKGHGQSPGVSPRVCGVVPGSVIPEPPIRKPVMRVSEHIVRVEEIREGHLSERDDEPIRRRSVPEIAIASGKKFVLWLLRRFIGRCRVTEREGLLNEGPGDIGSARNGGNAHHVEIRERRDALTLADSSPARKLRLNRDPRTRPERGRGEQRCRQRRGGAARALVPKNPFSLVRIVKRGGGLGGWPLLRAPIT